MSSSSMRKRHKSAEHEEANHNSERWLLTYADMITLLMVLFILLFAISQVDQKKFDQLAAGLAHQFGSPQTVMAGQTSILSSSSAAIGMDAAFANPAIRAQMQADIQATPPRASDAQLQAAAQRHAVNEATDFARAKAAILAALHRAGFDGAVQFKTDQRGMTVSVITDRVLFAADLADLAPEGRGLLEAIAPALQVLPNDLLVEGHTNDVAVRPKFYPTEWELSSARAVTVVRFLIEKMNIDAKRMGAVGYADKHPLLPSSDPRSVVVNRRVDIVILSALTPVERNLLVGKASGNL